MEFNELLEAGLLKNPYELPLKSKLTQPVFINCCQLIAGAGKQQQIVSCTRETNEEPMALLVPCEGEFLLVVEDDELKASILRVLALAMISEAEQQFGSQENWDFTQLMLIAYHHHRSGGLNLVSFLESKGAPRIAASTAVNLIHFQMPRRNGKEIRL